VAWFRPMRAAMSAPEVRRIRRGAGARDWRIRKRDRRGNSFCQVDRMRQRRQVRPAITLGNQKWVGAAPTLVIRPRRTIHSGSAFEIEGIESIMAPPISIKAPRVWVRRYLVADSYSGDDLDWIMRGINANKLSSIPARTIIQLEAERAIMGPEPLIRMKSVLMDLQVCIKDLLETERVLGKIFEG